MQVPVHRIEGIGKYGSTGATCNQLYRIYNPPEPERMDVRSVRYYAVLANLACQVYLRQVRDLYEVVLRRSVH